MRPLALSALFLCLLTPLARAQLNSPTRYGPLNLFDDRTSVGTGFFPEPFLVDEGDVDRELELSWVHQEGHGDLSDTVTGEAEFSLGLATFEFGPPSPRQTPPDDGSAAGVGPVEIAVRHPIFQY